MTHDSELIDMLQGIFFYRGSELDSKSEDISSMGRTDNTDILIKEYLVEYSEESLRDDPVSMNCIYLLFLDNPDEMDESI